MNPDTGEFVKETAAAPLPAPWPRFEIGEIVTVKGVMMRIDRIYPDGLKLRPVVRDKAIRDQMLRQNLAKTLKEPAAAMNAGNATSGYGMARGKAVKRRRKG